MTVMRVENVREGMYKVWVDLDTKHEAYLKFEGYTPIDDVIKMVEDLKDRYQKGLPITYWESRWI